MKFTLVNMVKKKRNKKKKEKDTKYVIYTGDH